MHRPATRRSFLSSPGRIHIITGDADAGKTSHLIAIYTRDGVGDGLCMPKAFSRSAGFAGYDILHLASGKRRPLARLPEHLPAGWREVSRCGRFSFAAFGFAFAAEAVAEIIRSRASPVYLDEVGPLELSGQGFNPLLLRLRRAGCPLVLSVRRSLVAEVISAYGLEDVFITSLPNPAGGRGIQG